MKLYKYNEFLNEQNTTEIETELNVVDTIKRSDIKGEVPEGAQYAMLNPTGEFIQAFFRIKNHKYNDATNKNILEYISEEGFSWMPSSYNIDRIKLKDVKFLKIED